MRAFTAVTSRIVPLTDANIDTDQIIPARFLKVTDKLGLGEHLFEDLRRGPDGSLKEEFVLNLPEHKGAEVLLAGDNFGCGSSREHAAWALAAYGFRVVMSRSFADIFHANALKNGLLPVVLTPADYDAVLALSRRGEEVTVDLQNQQLSWSDTSRPFTIEPFARLCLLEGRDELEHILTFERKIAAFESRHFAQEVR